MKCSRIRTICILLAAVAFTGWLATASATERLTGQSATLPRTRTVADDLIAASGTLLIEGVVEGDVVAAGGDVTLSGAVQGDVLAAGGNVVVSGPVGDDVRAAGGSVIIGGSVRDNVALAGGNVVLQPGATVGRDASLAGGSVRTQGKVGRNLSICAGEAVITGEVGGSVEARVQRLKLLPGAVVRGNLIVYSTKPAEISPEARVLGSVDHRAIPVPPRQGSRFSWVGWLMQFAWIFVIGAAVLAFSRRWMEGVMETLIHRPGMSILAGFVGLLLVPLVSVLLLVTVIGLPLGFILLALYLVALCLACAFVSYLLGSALLTTLRRTPASPFVRLLVGALLVSAAICLPVVGWLFQLIVLVVGFGGLALERRERWLHLRSEDAAIV
jgi:hypothetical protein